MMTAHVDLDNLSIQFNLPLVLFQRIIFSYTYAIPVLFLPLISDEREKSRKDHEAAAWRQERI
jgi:hypothetical protein